MAVPTQFILEAVVEGTDQSVAEVDQLGAAFDELGSKLEVVGGIMTAAITAPLLALGKSMVTLSADAEETQNKFAVVFGDSASNVNKSIDSIAQSIGRSSNIIRENVADYGALLEGMNFTKEVAGELSPQLVQIAKDLASFHNTSDAQAFDALRSGLVGMSRPLEQFGINVKQSALEIKAHSMGLQGSYQDLSEQQKAIVLTAQVYEKLGQQGAVGDAERTANSFSNSLKHLQDNFHDIQIEIGGVIKEAIRPFLNQLVAISEKWKSLDQPTKAFIVQMGILAAAIGPVVLGLGLLITSLSAIATPIGLITAGIVALVAAFGYLYVSSEKFRETANSAFSDVWNNAKVVFSFLEEALNNIATLFSKVWTAIGPIVVTVFKEMSAAVIEWAGIFKSAWEDIWKALQPILDAISAFFQQHMVGILAIVTNVFGTIRSIVSDVMTVISDIIVTVLDVISGNWSGAWEHIKDLYSHAWNAMLTFVTQIGANIVSAVAALVTGIYRVFDGFGEKMRDLGKGGIESLKQGIVDSLPAIKDAALAVVNTILSTLSLIINPGYAIGKAFADNTSKGMADSFAAGNGSGGGQVQAAGEKLASNLKSGLGSLLSVATTVGKGVVKNISKELDAGQKTATNFSDYLKGTLSSVGGAGGKASEAIGNIPKDAFLSGQPSFDRINQQYADFASKVTQLPAKLQPAFKEIYDTWVKTSDGIQSSITDLADAFDSNMTRIGQSIGDANDKMAELNKNFADTNATAIEALKQKFVEQSNSINDIAQKIADEQVKIADNAAKQVTQQLKFQYEASLKILDDQKTALDAQLNTAKDAANAFKEQTSELDKQNQILNDRQKLQESINDAILTVNRAQRAVTSPSPTDDIDELQAKLQEAVFKKQQADKALADFEAKQVVAAQQAVLDSAVKALETQQKVVTDGITQFQDQNNAQVKQRQDAADAASLLSTQQQLRNELAALQDNYDEQTRALNRGISRERQYVGSLASIQREAQKDSLATYISGWNAKQLKAEEAYNKEKDAINKSIAIYANQRDALVYLNYDALDKIARAQSDADNIYKTSLNQQVLASKSATDLMKQYFDAVTGSVKGLASSLNDVSKIKVPSIGLSASQSGSISTVPYIPPVVAPPKNGSVTVNIDTMVGTKQFALDVGNSIAKQLGYNTNF